MEDMSFFLLKLFLILLASFGCTAWLCHMIIPVLRSRHIGQHVLGDVLEEHRGKEGTPTMGGITFLLTFLFFSVPMVFLLRVREDSGCIPFALSVALGVGNSMIGFFDDFRKLCRKENKGLESWQKFLLQVALAILYVVAMHRLGGLDRVVELRLLHKSLDLGFWYDPLAILVIVGVVNATNVTDGIDGLASGVFMMAAGSMALLALYIGNQTGAMTSTLLVGCVLGFLVYNYHPAKVFMGDTGSLFLGGILIGMGFQMDIVLPTLLIAGIFIIEMLTSLIQILSIRLFHRRVFPRAPIHHTFELMHWNEEKIVFVFSAVGAILGAAALMLCMAQG